MSTRKKETIPSVRGKSTRGSSPSLSPSHHLKTSPQKPSKTVSTSRSLDSSPSDKPIPNYLKPTLSSSGDATRLQQARKHVSNTDSALKSSLARRRSFDKPPSPTRILKARGVSPTPAFRSSSFSGKIGAGKGATSPIGERSLKQHSPLYARSIKKSASGKSISKKGDEALDQESSIAESKELEEQQSVVEDQEIHEQIEDEVHNADSPAVLEHDLDLSGDDGKVESPPVVDDPEANIKNGETQEICEENVSEVESPALSEQDKVESPAASEKQDSINVDESLEDSESPNVESQQVGDVSPAASDKSCIEEVSDREQEMNPDQGAGGDPNEEAGEGAKAGDDEASGGRVNEEAEEKHGAKEEDENAAPKVAHGKKDVALSNNVIEEMTREQRRNKVRALAGAFETVISLQEHK